MEKNSFASSTEQKDEEIEMKSLFGLISFINHGRETNIMTTSMGPRLNIMYAARDIRAGEEILLDYTWGATGSEEADEILKAGSIQEPKLKESIE